MKAEKIPQEQRSRTLQNKRNNSAAAQFMDRRSSQILQAVADTTIQRVEDEEDAIQGKFSDVAQRELDEEEPIQGKIENIVQKQSRYAYVNSDEFRSRFFDKSDSKTHSPHMTARDIIKDPIKFREKSQEGYYAEAHFQAMNGIRKEEVALEKKLDRAKNDKKRDQIKDEIAQLKPNNTGMPDSLKSSIESLSGYSMDNVRVHYNSDKPAAVQAHAYTQGQNIHIAPGQEQYLPHEAWHVTQQMAGRVEPTIEVDGMPINDNASLEHEADVMGARAEQLGGKS